jgi:beta-mannosidase
MTAGIWRPVRLETYNKRIDDVSVQYSIDDTLRSCQGTIHVQLDVTTESEVLVDIHAPDGTCVFEKQITIQTAADVPFDLESILLWYPHSYGSQPLYTLTCKLMESGVILHTATKRIGFRRVQLIQEDDSYGKSFYFNVNGIDIFAGGSCWIPADPLIPRITAQKYRDYLMPMVESNQVMIR